MTDEDKTTIKFRNYSGDAKNAAPQSNLTEEQARALELAKKSAQLEDELKKSLEYQGAIEQLRESIKQEQAKSADMAKKIARLEARATELTRLESKTREFAELQAKAKDLAEVLGKISGDAAA